MKELWRTKNGQTFVASFWCVAFVYCYLICWFYWIHWLSVKNQYLLLDSQVYGLLYQWIYSYSQHWKLKRFLRKKKNRLFFLFTKPRKGSFYYVLYYNFMFGIISKFFNFFILTGQCSSALEYGEANFFRDFYIGPIQKLLCLSSRQK